MKEVINMNEEVLEAKARAEIARLKYGTKQITREEALEEIMPYIDMVNKRSVELAKKYNQKPKKVSFNVFVR